MTNHTEQTAAERNRLAFKAHQLATSMHHSAGTWMVPGWDGHKVGGLLEELSIALTLPAAASSSTEPVAWAPTPDNINALPKPVREYIHALVANTDPAGMVRENAQLRDTNEGLQRMYRRAADAVSDVIGCFNAATIEGLTEALTETQDERLKDLVERRLMHALYAAEAAPPASWAAADMLLVPRDLLLAACSAIDKKRDGTIVLERLRVIVRGPAPHTEEPALMVDMVPPATARDRWMYEQGRLAERDPRSHVEEPAGGEAVTPANLRIGGRYNWKNQPERLSYLGMCEPRNGRWHQFAKVEEPGIVWCEVRAEDLASFERTATPPQAPAVPAGLSDALRMALAYVRWQAFGECRSVQWDGPPPAPAAVDEALRAALAASSAPPASQDAADAQKGQP